MFETMTWDYGLNQVQHQNAYMYICSDKLKIYSILHYQNEFPTGNLEPNKKPNGLN